MARKIKDDDDNDTVSSAAAEIEAELAQAKGKKVTESVASGDVEIDLDDEDDEEDEAPAQTSAEQRSRNERRRDRYKENKERAEQLERDLEAERERARQATLRADAMALSFRQQAQGPQADPIDEEIKQARAEKQRMFDDVAHLPQEVALEPTRYKAFTDKLHEIDERIFGLIARKNAPQQPQGPSPGRILADTQFPDVMAHPEGSKRTDALMQYKLALGEPNTPATLIACLTEVRAQLRTGGPRRDVQSLQKKLSHSSASRGSSPGDAPRRVVTLDAAKRKLAKATYKGQGLSDQQMYAKFAREYMQDD